MSVAEIDVGKGSGVAVASAGVTGAVAGGDGGINLLIVIGVMAIVAVGFYLFVRHHANKENGL